MSKLVPLLLAGVGSTGVSVAGVGLLNREKGSVDTQKPQVQPESLTLYDSVDTFQSANGDSCVHDLFGTSLGMNNLSGSSELQSGNTSSLTDYFGSAPAKDTDSSGTKGCLIINWKKATKESKGSGTFTGSGAFTNGNKGFIVFGVARTTTSKKLSLAGVTYLLSKEDGSDWSIKYHKKKDNNEITDSETEFDKKFPNAKENIDVIKDNKNYWEFINGASDLANVCEDASCPADSSPDTRVYKWKWVCKSEGQHKIGEWCGTLEWWNNVFGVSSFDGSSKLDCFVGTGTKQPVSSGQ